MLIKNDIIESFSSVNKIFNVFVALIAAIALFIAFFLLLVASTQNVNDAIWEYGVLRSMGLTKAEGLRLYIYEAYIVVITAAILGTIVGFVTAAAVSIQFYSFVELPITIDVSGNIRLIISSLTLVPLVAFRLHDSYLNGHSSGRCLDPYVDSQPAPNRLSPQRLHLNGTKNGAQRQSTTKKTNLLLKTY